ncbi:50S ribosomal protein L6 [Candidatus Saccharibacteria bacterium]|nr:50S ribosomal protein L6 [Candidatus Saccharibacteria bacterium]
MSRIGKQPIKVPSGVNVTINDSEIVVTGPKGELKQAMLPGISVAQDADMLQITRQDDERRNRSNHGLMRSLISNMITGVSEGFSKKLEIQGVGFRVAMAGTDLKLNLGLSHEVIYKVPQDITITTEQNTITVNGIDRQRVGQIAAEIRALKKPEPYKGKGIRYDGEHIIRKSGKSGKE